MEKRMKGSSGVAILEVTMVVAIVSVLASIAFPHYMEYLGKARAIHCLANRYHAELEFYSMESRADEFDGIGKRFAGLRETYPVCSFLHRVLSSTPGVAHAAVEDFHCPEGGVYVVVQDPANPDRSRVICSLHGGVTSRHDDEKDPRVLFQTDFDNLDEMDPTSGKWRAENGVLIPDEKQGVEHRIHFGDDDWTDYEIAVNATLYTGWGYGVYYRGDGEKRISSYVFQYDPKYGAFIVRKVFDGHEQSPFQRADIPGGFPVFNQSHEISITVSGNRHVIEIDGNVILDFTDDTFLSGGAGFRTWAKSQAAFDNTVVYALDQG